MSMLPAGIMLYITDHCTLSCGHCFWHLHTEGRHRHMPMSIIEAALDECKSHNVFMVGVSGGDPVLHPEFLSVLQAIQVRRMLPLVGLTGVGIDRALARGIHAAGVPCVQVSIDGSTEEINRRYRGDGVLAQVVQSVEILQSESLNVNLAICLDRHNEDDLLNMLAAAATMGIYKVKVQMWRNPAPHSSLFSNEALDVASVNAAAECIRDFEAQRGLHDWVSYAGQPVDSRSLARQYHDSNLILFPDGSVLLDELAAPIGRFPDCSLEEVYGEYVTRAHSGD